MISVSAIQGVSISSTLRFGYKVSEAKLIQRSLFSEAYSAVNYLKQSEFLIKREFLTKRIFLSVERIPVVQGAQ